VVDTIRMPRQAALFVLIDALGWEWVKPTRFLEGIAPYRCPLGTVLGYSAGAIPSILTGLQPAEHGRLAMYQRAGSSASPFRQLKWLCNLPPELIENRYFRRAFKAVVWRLCGIAGYFELYHIPLHYLPHLDVAEKKCVYRPGGIPGALSIFDVLQANGVPYKAYWYASGSDAELFSQVENDLRMGEIKFYFLYLAGMDAFLHEHADDAMLIRGFLADYEARLRRVYQIARQHFDRVDLHVFSDHGMAPTRATVDLRLLLAGIDLDPVKSCLVLIDSTMARFWFHSEVARCRVKSVLRNNESGHWLDESELKSMGAWFADCRYGEEIYLLSEGVVFAPSHMGRTAPKGMHGFHPAAQHSFASFLSSQDYGDQLRSITDIFRVMERYRTNR
jgi:hypothetical protein